MKRPCFNQKQGRLKYYAAAEMNYLTSFLRGMFFPLMARIITLLAQNVNPLRPFGGFLTGLQETVKPAYVNFIAPKSRVK